MRSITQLESESEQARVRFELLRRCVRAPLNEQEEENIRLLLAEGFDWTSFLGEARRHGLMPLLYWHLKRIYPHAIPPAPLDALQNYFLANAKRNLLFVREITRLVGLLQSNEIPVIFLKGPLLGVMIYGNPFLRVSADLDYLIHRSDFPKVKSLLSAEGYVPSGSFSRFEQRSLLHCAPECHFIHSVNRIELDVHWEMLSRTLSYAFDDDQIWQRIQYFRLGSTQVPTISPEELLLFLCVHGSKHCWERLSWICDIAAFIGAHPALDWPLVLKRAEIQGAIRMLFLGLALACELLALELPPEVSFKMRADVEVDALAAEVREWLTSGRSNMLGKRKRIGFHFRVTKRCSNKIRYLSRLAMSPTTGDLLLLPLPRTLSFLYCVIRPFRLVAKCGLIAAKLFAAELRVMGISEWL
jgi:Uncharacterised nucleotidyltransferase